MKVLVFLGVLFIAFLIIQQYISLKRNNVITTQDEKRKDLILPDLIASQPEQIYIESTSQVRKIRFSTTSINIGKGSLMILAESNPEKSLTKVKQKILKIDGSTEDYDVGEFVFHSNHSHWHIENYTKFELWSYQEDGKKDQLKATTNKMSFCLWDEAVYDLSIENASQTQRYVGCNNQTQGISVGWSDTYQAEIEGQELDISQVPDGKYLVITTINPDHNILESDYSNNESTLYIEVVNDILTVNDIF